MSKKNIKFKKKYLLFFILLGIVCFLGYLLFLIQKSTKEGNENTSVYKIDYGQIKRFEEEISILGAVNAYKKLKKNTGNIGYVNRHNLAHIFGKALYNVKNEEGILICDSELSYGCYHGLLVQALLKEGPSVVKKLNADCWRIESVATACEHGIGHGLVEYYGPKNLLKALQGCEQIQRFMFVGCSSGVFMEYFFPSPLNNSNALSPHINPNDPFAICKDLPGKFRPSCFFELPRLWRLSESNYDVLISRCRRLHKNEFIENTCFRGVGFTTSSPQHQDIKFSIATCEKTPSEIAKTYCLAGARWFYGTLDDSPVVRNATRTLCTYTINRYECLTLSDLHKEKIRP